MKIWANTIVNNEENFLWFSVTSVIDYVDKVIIWDTGSTDKTVKVVKELRKVYGEKISFKEVGEVSPDKFTKMRQQMLEQSTADWILILDGDEVWWKESIKKVVDEIERKDNLEGIVVPMYVPVGDIYHFQSEKAGKYQILGRTGHLSLKLFNKKIPGLHVNWPYGKEGFFDKDNRLIQERKNIIFVNAPFLHLTHLRRSSKKRLFEKFKYELGDKIEDSFKLPEVLLGSYPDFIPNPLVRISGIDLIKSKVLTPLRKVKRVFA